MIQKITLIPEKGNGVYVCAIIIPVYIILVLKYTLLITTAIAFIIRKHTFLLITFN